MYISKIAIKGFKCFDAEGSSIYLNKEFNAFIGLNSTGKTTALEALSKVFGITSAERTVHEKDFHVAKDEGTDIKEKHIAIEIRLDFDDDNGEESIPHFFNSMVIDEEGSSPYIRIRLESIWTSNHYTEEGDIDTKLYFINIPEDESEVDNAKVIFPKHLRGLIQTFYVPAIRRPSEQLRYVSGSILYRILSTIEYGDSFREQYKEKIKGINNLFADVEGFNKIEEALTNIWGEFHKDARYKDVTLSFGTDEIESILKKMEVIFSPTEINRPYYVDDLGEGYRSLFYFTLVCSLLKIESEQDNQNHINPLLTVLAIEEPENHISPQLLGRVARILMTISEQNNAQVFVSSHTPAIIKRVPPESIFHFRINKNYSSEIHRIELPDEREEAYKYVKEAVKNYPEIYFARLVVIGEGESEAIIFNRLMEVYDKDFDDNIISFVPLGHRFVNHIWKLLNSLNIPYITLLDLDIEREGGGWGRIKYALKQLINIGVDKNELLTVEGGAILSDNELNNMHTWVYTDNNILGIMSWVNNPLKTYDVFYSAPLDLDFLMLENYSDAYKKAIPKNGGPQIPDRINVHDEFQEKVDTAVQATLKSEKAIGVTYSNEQKELMIWYNYHFLGRGKPVTHINALALINNDDLKKNIPPVFKEIFKRIDQMLLGE